MANRYKKPVAGQEEQEGPSYAFTPWQRPELPLEFGLGIYARQSSLMQVKNAKQSNEMQTKDLVQDAINMGWSEDKITVFAQDMARSGRLKIIDREGMFTLTQMIERGEIKAVMAAKEDRLFRDETGLEYNHFIQVCKKYNCLVLIPPFTVYNFANKRDVKEFRYQCEKAADFLDDYVGRLQYLRERAVRNGLFAGGYTPVGTTVDRRRTIEGKPNPNYKKLIRYEPHAEVVDWCFEQFYRLGSVNAVVREAEKEGKRFPEFEDGQTSTLLKHADDEKGGYLITHALLHSVFTNVTYIGHIVYGGRIIAENARPPFIKDPELFWYAFDRVSSHTLDGELKSGRRTRRSRSKETDEMFLLKYLVTSTPEKQIYVKLRHSKNDAACYCVLYVKPNGLRVYDSEVSADLIDEVFTERLRTHLQQMQTKDYSAEIQRQKVQVAAYKDKLRVKLEMVKEQRNNIFEWLVAGKMNGEKLREDTKQKLRARDVELSAKQDELAAELREEGKTKAEDEALRFRHLVLEHGEYWEGYPMRDKQEFLESIVKGVDINFPTTHFIELKITWVDPEWGEDIAYIWSKQRCANPDYTEAELEIVKSLYPAASMRTILEALPTRTWQSIIRQAYLMHLKRKRTFRIDPLPAYCTVKDIEFIEEKGIDITNTMKDKYVYWLELR